MWWNSTAVHDGGSSIVIEIRDDGQGLMPDPKATGGKAIEKGLTR